MTTTVRPPRRREEPPGRRGPTRTRATVPTKKASNPSPRIRRPRPTKPVGRRSSLFVGLFALIVILNLVGLLMVLSASAVGSNEEYGSPWYQFQRQLLWLVIGSIALIVTMRIDYHAWRRRATLFVVASIVLLVFVLLPGFGLEVNGASRWLGFGSFRIQPSEIAKLALLVFVADLLARRAHRIDDTRLTLRPVIAVFLVLAGLIMLQPNLGTTIILGVIVFVMLFVAGVPLKPLGVTAAGGAAAAVMFAFVEPYRYRRLMGFRDPWADPLNTGYQTIQAQVGVANGGLIGTGLGEGRAKWGFLPFPHTDFIFAVIGEELGSGGRPHGDRAFPRSWGARHPHRATGARPLRHVDRGRRDHLDPLPGLREHRCGHRRVADHGCATAVRLVRWIIAPRAHGGGGTVVERRAPRAASHPREVMERSTPTYALVAGGGTAGHIIPGLAVAAALVARGHAPDSLVFVGSERGLENRTRSRSRLSTGRLAGPRHPAPAHLGERRGDPRHLARRDQGDRLVRRLRPKVVLVVGGYASVACTVGAVLWRVPIVVTEQNARAGAANRLAG